MTDEQKAVLASEILNSIDPTVDNMQAFVGNLEENHLGELQSHMPCDDLPDGEE